MREEGYSWEQIAEAFANDYLCEKRHIDVLRRQYKRLLKENYSIPKITTEEKIIEEMKKGYVNLSDIKEKYSLKEKQLDDFIDRISENLFVDKKGNNVRIVTDNSEQKAIKTIEYKNDEITQLAFISDLHAGSASQALEECRDFVEYAYSKDIHEIYIGGDLLAGVHMHAGMEYETKNNIEDQLKLMSAALPKKDDLKYKFILGNHDMSFTKQIGLNVGRYISLYRPDLEYLGAEEAQIEIDNFKIRLVHPDGGVSYALSYKPQKFIESLQAISTDIDMVLMGHYHVHSLVHYGRTVGISLPAFEHQTMYLSRKGKVPTVGGIILTLYKQNGAVSFTYEAKIYKTKSAYEIRKDNPVFEIE